MDWTIFGVVMQLLIKSSCNTTRSDAGLLIYNKQHWTCDNSYMHHTTSTQQTNNLSWQFDLLTSPAFLPLVLAQHILQRYSMVYDVAPSFCDSIKK